MKTLVTGGCGFIGYHLVHGLLDLGHQVIVVDDLSSGKNKIEGHKNVTYHYRSICGEIEDLFENVNCVFHLAAESRIQLSILDPIRTARINLVGTINVLEACRKNKVPKFVNASSASVYGKTDVFPTPEDTEKDCLSPYTVTKSAAEEIVKYYSRTQNISTFNLRYCNVFGERCPATGPRALLVATFLEQRRKEEPLTVVGDGSNSRDFIYVGDVVDANIRCLSNEPQDGCSTLNIGSGKDYSVLELARYISQNIIFTPPKDGETKKTLADNTKAKELLGWEPTVDLLDWIRCYTN
jgi:UDP-glucose 4-epimerase